MSSLIRLDEQSQRIQPGEFGYFADGGRTFVVTTPVTPTPWVNVIANESYGLVVSQAGSGFSWFENSQLCRLNRWENDLIQDRQGRYLYLQDRDSGDVWSTSYQPTLREADLEEVRHGLGHTTYVRELNGIRSEQTVLVPLNDACEVWTVTIHNLTARHRRLRFATYLEWFIGGAGEFHREFYRLFIETRSVGNTHLAWRHAGLLEGKRGKPETGPTCFVSIVGTPVLHWMSNKQEFLGNPARLDAPGALVQDCFPKGNGRWEDPCAASAGDLNLEPGQSITFCVTIGAGEDAVHSLKLAEKYTPSVAESALVDVKTFWEDLCSKSQLDSGLEDIDVMANFWLRYQALAGRMVARCAYYQQGGAFGYRDQLQDSLSLLSAAPERTRRQLLIQSEAMYEDGAVRHWWHPNTNIFAKSHHSDTCLWLAFGTLAYLAETNDLKVLEAPSRFLSHESEEYGKQTTLLDHCLTGIRRTLDRMSPRGIPLILAGDWNDGLSHAGLDGKGESVWLGMFLYHILSELAAFLPDVGLGDKAREFESLAADLAEAVNQHGWDGDWYLEGVCDDGRPLGGRDNKFGQLYLNPQTWAVISGIAPQDRVEKAMKAVKERLVKPYGVLLLDPAYSEVDPWVGYITRYAPGLRENGGVYSHASTWAVQALAMVGDTDTALNVYRSMLPSRQRDRALYAAEPYVMPGNVDGPDSPNEGRAGWTWYTGSAAWMQRMAFDYLTGIRATRRGLAVSPVPSALAEFNLKRHFRGQTFQFECEPGNSFSVRSETATVTEGNIVSGGGNGASHVVRVARPNLQ